MKDKKKLALTGSAILASTALCVGLTFTDSTKIADFAKANEPGNAFVFDSSAEETTEGYEVTTEKGNNVQIFADGVTKAGGVFNFAAGGVISNTAENGILGIESMVFDVDGDSSFVLKVGTNPNHLWTSYIVDSDKTVTLGSMASYFELSSAAEAALASVRVNYACAPVEDTSEHRNTTGYQIVKADETGARMEMRCDTDEAVMDSHEIEAPVDNIPNHIDQSQKASGYNDFVDVTEGKYAGWMKPTSVAANCKNQVVFVADANGQFKMGYDVKSESDYRWDWLKIEQKRGSSTVITYNHGGTTGQSGEEIFECLQGDLIVATFVRDGTGGPSDTYCYIQVAEGGVRPYTAEAVTFVDEGNGTKTGIFAIDGKLVADMPTPVRDNYYFGGWYLEESHQTKVEQTTVFEADTCVYARWVAAEDASPLMGNHKANGIATGTSTSVTAGAWMNVDFDGNFEMEASGISAKGRFVKNEETGVYEDAQGYKLYVNEETGLMVMSMSKLLGLSTTYVGFLGADAALPTAAIASSPLADGNERYVEVTKESTTYSFFINYRTNTVYFGATYKVESFEEDISATTLADALILTIKDAQGSKIKSYGLGKDQTDTFAGDYELDNGEYVTVSGNGKLVYTGNTDPDARLTYVVTAENTIEAESTGNYSYTFVLDTESMTGTFTNNVFTVTYDWNGHTPEGAPTNSNPIPRNSWLYDTSTPKVANNVMEDNGTLYYFCGWYSDSSLETPYASQKVTENFTIYAKWVLGVTVTLDEANGNDPTTQYLPIGGKATLSEPSKAGHMFVGWYNGEEPVNAETTYSINTVLTAHYEELPPFATTYAKYNVYGESVVERTNVASSNCEIKSDGAFHINSTTATDKFDLATAYDEENHVLVGAKASYTTYIKDGHTFIFHQQSSGDWYFLASNNPDGTPLHGVRQFWIDTINSCRIWVFNLTYANGDSYTFFDIAKSAVVPFVTIKNADDEEVSFDALYTGNRGANNQVIKIFDENDNFVTGYGWDGSHYKEGDELAGTYTGIIGGVDSTVELSGFGTGRLNGDACTYSQTADGATIVCNGLTHNVTIDGSVMTEVLDGNEGTYTGPNGELVLTGWGECTLAGEAGTYIIKPNFLQATIGENILSFTVDTEAHTYDVVPLSIFSGLKFTYSSSDYLQFDADSTEPNGRAYLGYSAWWCDFTGEYNAETKTLVITFYGSGSGNPGCAGKKVTFTASNGKLYVSKSEFKSSYSVTPIYEGRTYTCSDFVI